MIPCQMPVLLLLEEASGANLHKGDIIGGRFASIKYGRMMLSTEYTFFPKHGQDKKNAQCNLDPDAPVDSSRALFWTHFVKNPFLGRGPCLGPIRQTLA